MFPDVMLERFVLGELDAENTRRLEAALANSPELKARLEALEADTRATLAQHPPQLVERLVSRRLADAPPAHRWPLRFAVPAFAGLAAVLWLIVAPHPVDDVLLKGDGPALRLFRLGDAGPERLGDGASAREHDVIQVAFEVADAAYLVVVSIDGRGGATLHFPLDGDTRVPAGAKAVPQAFELDDAPGFERFFLVAGRQPLVAADLVEQARRLARGPAPRTAALPVPPGATVRSVRLDKVNP